MIKKGLKSVVIMLLVFMWTSLFMGAYQIKEDLPVKIPDITVPNIEIPPSNLEYVDISQKDVNTILKKVEQENIVLAKEQKKRAKPVTMELGNDIYSKNAVLEDLDTGDAICQKAADEKIYPASLTKMMTIILAIENIDDLKKEVVMSRDMIESLNASNASMAGFMPNERVRAIDLIYGAAMPSGADAANALAICASGSVDDFVSLMNARAKELGLDGTHFTNPSGLHDSQQYTTANDLAKLLRYALKNPLFKEVFTAREYTTAPTNMHPGGLHFYNFIFKYLSSTDRNSTPIIGGKTGYTKEAGLCLATLAQVGDRQYILITAAADGTMRTMQYNIEDAVDIYGRYAS